MELALLCANRFWSYTCSPKKLDPSAMGLGRKEQDRSRAAYLAHRYASNRKPMPGALVKTPSRTPAPRLADQRELHSCMPPSRQRLFQRELSTEHYDGTGFGAVYRISE